MAALKTFGERIADALVEDGLLFQKQVEELLKQQKKEGTRLLKIIVDKAYVTEQDMAVSMGRVLNTPPVNLNRLSIDLAVADLLPRDICLTHKVLAVSRLENKLFLALADPLNVLAIDDVRRITKMEVAPMIASEKSIIEKLHHIETGKTGRMERKALPKVSPMSFLTGTWLIPGIWNSTGSSTVTMLYSELFNSLSAE
jgi:type IV pilus assembly protein PilB